MTRQKTTLNGVINLTELQKAVKKADVLIWERLPENRHFICNSHFFAVIQSCEVYADLFAALVARMGGKIPEEGKGALWARQNREAEERGPMGAEYLQKIDRVIPVRFTGLKIDAAACGDAPADLCLFSAPGDNGAIIWGVSETYAKLAAGGSVWAEKASGKAPLIFGDPDYDFLYILPVNLSGNTLAEKIARAL